MRRTLFHIPSEIFGLDLFGFGLLLFVWLTVLLIVSIFVSRQSGFVETAKAVIPYAIVGSGVILFLLPRLAEEIPGSAPAKGLPIRAYGALMMVAVMSGLWLAVKRAKARGVPADWINGLGVWMFVAGFAGARLFFVYQYREHFQADTWQEFLGEAVNIAEGGLVVYGSVIGASVAFMAFMWKHKLPPLAFADIIAPSLLLGLAIGRMGCLMNGCCYGGPCDYPWAIEFPQDSDPYMDQLETGLSHGLHLKTANNHQIQIAIIRPDGPADKAGLKPGTIIKSIGNVALEGPNSLNDAKAALTAATVGAKVTMLDESGNSTNWTADYAPPKSHPTHPAQIYSTLNAMMIFLLLLAVAPFQKRDGILIALTLTIYPVTRFLLEIVRKDEGIVNGFGFTISQTISFGVVAVAILIWYFALNQPPGKQHAPPATDI